VLVVVILLFVRLLDLPFMDPVVDSVVDVSLSFTNLGLGDINVLVPSEFS